MKGCNLPKVTSKRSTNGPENKASNEAVHCLQKASPAATVRKPSKSKNNRQETKPVESHMKDQTKIDATGIELNLNETKYKDKICVTKNKDQEELLCVSEIKDVKEADNEDQGHLEKAKTKVQEQLEKDPEKFKKCETKGQEKPMEAEIKDQEKPEEADTKNQEKLKKAETKDHEQLEKAETKDQDQLKEVETKNQEKIEEVDTKDQEKLEKVDTKDQGKIEDAETKDQEQLKEVETKNQEKIEEVETKDQERLEEVDTKDQGKIEEVETKDQEKLKEVETKDQEKPEEAETKDHVMLKEAETKDHVMPKEAETNDQEKQEVTNPKVQKESNSVVRPKDEKERGLREAKESINEYVQNAGANDSKGLLQNTGAKYPKEPEIPVTINQEGREVGAEVLHYLELVVNKDPTEIYVSEVQDQIEMTGDKVQANSEFAEPKNNIDLGDKVQSELKMPKAVDLLESDGLGTKDQDNPKDTGSKDQGGLIEKCTIEQEALLKMAEESLVGDTRLKDKVDQNVLVSNYGGAPEVPREQAVSHWEIASSEDEGRVGVSEDWVTPGRRVPVNVLGLSFGKGKYCIFLDQIKILFVTFIDNSHKGVQV